MNQVEKMQWLEERRMLLGFIHHVASSQLILQMKLYTDLTLINSSPVVRLWAPPCRFCTGSLVHPLQCLWSSRGLGMSCWCPWWWRCPEGTPEDETERRDRQIGQRGEDKYRTCTTDIKIFNEFCCATSGNRFLNGPAVVSVHICWSHCMGQDKLLAGQSVLSYTALSCSYLLYFHQVRTQNKKFPHCKYHDKC